MTAGHVMEEEERDIENFLMITNIHDINIMIKKRTHNFCSENRIRKVLIMNQNLISMH